MLKKEKIKAILKRAIAPVTIMFIPHSNTRRTLNLNIPAAGIMISAVLCCFGILYLSSMILDVIRYQAMEKQIRDYSQKVSDFNATLLSLKKAEKDLHQLISLGSKEKILETIDTSDMGAIDINQIQKQITSSMQTVGAIKDYLRSQKDLYLATPRGMPIQQGTITSPFGIRTHPITHRTEFHRGLDISTAAGNPVRATADGIVSFSGWNGSGGNVVVVEHGYGFSTYYAHNKMNMVEVGQKVKRGAVLGYVGSTGNATGSHVHYEVWHDGKGVNPIGYIQGGA